MTKLQTLETVSCKEKSLARACLVNKWYPALEKAKSKFFYWHLYEEECSLCLEFCRNKCSRCPLKNITGRNCGYTPAHLYESYKLRSNRKLSIYERASIIFCNIHVKQKFMATQEFMIMSVTNMVSVLEYIAFYPNRNLPEAEPLIRADEVFKQYFSSKKDKGKEETNA